MGKATKVSAPLAPDVRAVGLSDKAPSVSDGMRLPAAVEALPLDARPMLWTDLPALGGKYGRNAADMAYDLGVANRTVYARCVETALVVPFDLELLMRLYDRYPSSCAWQRPSIADVFELVYGDVIQSFPAELRASAFSVYGARFTRLLGRAPLVRYRWLLDETTGKGTTRRVLNIISKLYEAHQMGQSARYVLESIAVPMWRARGFDFDAAHPAYDPIMLARAIEAGRVARSAKSIDFPRRVKEPAQYEGGIFAVAD